MSANRKTEANRQNAQKSTGPKSAEGKRISAMNAMKHGLYAHNFRIDTETEDSYNNYQYQLLYDHQPKTAVELILIEQLLHAFLLSRRIVAWMPDIHFGAPRGGPQKFIAYPVAMKMIYQAARTTQKAIEQLRQIKLDREKAAPAAEPEEPLLNLPDDFNPLHLPPDTAPGTGFVSPNSAEVEAESPANQP